MSPKETATSRVEQFTHAQAAMLQRHGLRARPRYLAVPGGTAHVLELGEGPPVLLLNGVGTPGAMWAPLAARLPGSRVYLVDLPGFGLSALDEPLPQNLRPGVPRFLGGVLDELGLERAPVIANSFGSLCASWLALDEPARVTALAHIGCPALILGTGAPLPMRLIATRGVGAVLERLRPPSAGQVRGLAKMVHEHPLPTELVDLLVATERLPEFQRTFRPLLRQLLRVRGPRPEHALTAEQLSAIRQPTAFVWGNDDPFGAPAVGRRAAEAMPDASLHVVPGGHAPWVHHAEAVAEVVVPFLQRVSAPSRG
jgi:pimeloyl-ACP methyl ester carboxylesterase